MSAVWTIYSVIILFLNQTLAQVSSCHCEIYVTQTDELYSFYDYNTMGSYTDGTFANIYDFTCKVSFNSIGVHCVTVYGKKSIDENVDVSINFPVQSKITINDDDPRYAYYYASNREFAPQNVPVPIMVREGVYECCDSRGYWSCRQTETDRIIQCDHNFQYPSFEPTPTPTWQPTVQSSSPTLSPTTEPTFDCEHPSDYDENGVNCEWYDNCLEKQVKCGETGYPLNYGLYFCNRYQQSMDKFSNVGKLWVNQVKLCLQNELVPLLQDTDHLYDCKDVESIAYKSHSLCYLGRNINNGLSICDLNVNDWTVIFRTVYQGIFNVDGICQMYEIANKCTNDWINLFDIVFDNNYSEFQRKLFDAGITITKFGLILEGRFRKILKYLDKANDLVQFICSFSAGSIVVRYNTYSNYSNIAYSIQSALLQSISEEFYNFNASDFDINDGVVSSFQMSLKLEDVYSWQNITSTQYYYTTQDVKTSQPTSVEIDSAPKEHFKCFFVLIVLCSLFV